MGKNGSKEGTPTKVVRWILAVVFVAAGVMKLVGEGEATAFRLQLDSAGIPMADLAETVVPLVEIGIGALLALGLFTRIASLAAIAVMLVATYVHLKADAAAFPNQPQEPYVPIVVLAMALFLLWRKTAAAKRN